MTALPEERSCLRSHCMCFAFLKSSSTWHKGTWTKSISFKSGLEMLNLTILLYSNYSDSFNLTLVSHQKWIISQSICFCTWYWRVIIPLPSVTPAHAAINFSQQSRVVWDGYVVSCCSMFNHVRCIVRSQFGGSVSMIRPSYFSPKMSRH